MRLWPLLKSSKNTQLLAIDISVRGQLELCGVKLVNNELKQMDNVLKSCTSDRRGSAFLGVYTLHI